MRQKVEINFKFRMKNGVCGAKKVELDLPNNIVQEIRREKSGLPFLLPYLTPYIENGEEVLSYMYRIIWQSSKEKESTSRTQKEDIIINEKTTNVSNKTKETVKSKTTFDTTKKIDDSAKNIEKEKIELEIYRKEKEFELERKIKQQKIDNAKQELKEGGSLFIYVIKRLWIFADKLWKKYILFVIIMILIAGIYDLIQSFFQKIFN